MSENAHRFSLSGALALAALGYTVFMAQLTFHEVVGHGVTTEILGGQFLSFYVSPLLGFVDLHVNGLPRTVQRAVAPLLTLMLCAAVWPWLRSRPAPLARAAGWFVLFWGVIGSFGYWTVVPWFSSLSGPSDADWIEVWPAIGVPLFVPFLVGIPVTIWALGFAMREAQDVARVLGLQSSIGPTRAYWTIAGPWAGAQVAYVLAFWPFWHAADRWAIPSTLSGYFLSWLFGVLGLAIGARLRWLRLGPRPVASGHPPPSRRVFAACSSAGVALGLAVATIAGPATGLRRGVAVRPVTPPVYWDIANEADLELVITDDGSARFLVAAYPPRQPEGPFGTRRAEEAARVGPDTSVVRSVLAEYMGLVEGLTAHGEPRGPEFSAGRWHFERAARIDANETAFGIAYRPARIVVRAPGIRSLGPSRRGLDVISVDDSLAWVRPIGMYGPDEFAFRWIGRRGSD